MTAPDPILPQADPEPAATAGQTTGVLMYVAAAFLFALNGSVSKAQLTAGLSPLQVTEIRNAGAAVILLIILLVVRPRSLRVRRDEIPFLLGYGVLAFAVTQFLYFLTISLLPVGIGTLLAFLAPVLVALWLRIVRRQPVRRSIWTALALVLAGLALVSQAGSDVRISSAGLLAGLLLAVALAGYWLLGEAGAKRRDALSLTFWGFAIATLTWSLIAPWWRFPWPALTGSTSLLDGRIDGIPVWALVAWMVTMGTIAPFLLVVGSLHRIGSQRAGIVATTEPVWAAALAFLLLGETITGVQAVGGIIVLCGVVVAETASRRDR